MLPRLLPAVALVVGMNFTAASTTFAGPAKTGGLPRRIPAQHNAGNKKNQPTNEDPEPQHTTIALVSGNSITIQMGKDSKSFVITQDTVVEVKGARATVADLKPGMRVSITPGLDASLAGHITANDPPKETKKPVTADKGKGKG